MTPFTPEELRAITAEAARKAAASFRAAEASTEKATKQALRRAGKLWDGIAQKASTPTETGNG